MYLTYQVSWPQWEVCKISYKTNNIAKGSGSVCGVHVGAGCGGDDSHSVLVQKAIPAPALSQID